MIKLNDPVIPVDETDTTGPSTTIKIQTDPDLVDMSSPVMSPFSPTMITPNPGFKRKRLGERTSSSNDEDYDVLSTTPSPAAPTRSLKSPVAVGIGNNTLINSRFIMERISSTTTSLSVPKPILPSPTSSPASLVSGGSTIVQPSKSILHVIPPPLPPRPLWLQEKLAIQMPLARLIPLPPAALATFPSFGGGATNANQPISSPAIDSNYFDSLHPGSSSPIRVASSSPIPESSSFGHGSTDATCDGYTSDSCSVGSSSCFSTAMSPSTVSTPFSGAMPYPHSATNSQLLDAPSSPISTSSSTSTSHSAATELLHEDVLDLYGFSIRPGSAVSTAHTTPLTITGTMDDIAEGDEIRFYSPMPPAHPTLKGKLGEVTNTTTTEQPEEEFELI